MGFYLSVAISTPFFLNKLPLNFCSVNSEGCKKVNGMALIIKFHWHSVELRENYGDKSWKHERIGNVFVLGLEHWGIASR